MADDLYRAEVIGPGDKASKLAHRVCEESYGNSPLLTVVPLNPNSFRGAVGFTWKHWALYEMLKFGSGGLSSAEWSVLQMVENDGAGGKPQFFTLLGDEQAFEGLGWEIITMTADDLARRGAMPAVIENEMNVKRLTPQNLRFFEAIMRGYGRALKASRLVNITGETAVMKQQITTFCDAGSDDQLILTWGASCTGLVSLDTYVKPANIRPGMAVIGLLEKGYRCNGGTFFANLLMHLYGESAQNFHRNEIAREFVRKLTIPSQSYACFLNRLVGWREEGTVGKPLAKITGIAHITGGGVWEKFREMLPEGVGAVLDRMPEPPEVLRQAQTMAQGTPYEIADLACYGTFHGGCGCLLVCERSESSMVTRLAGEFGITAQLVGKTVESATREVHIRSRFHENFWLSSDELQS